MTEPPPAELPKIEVPGIELAKLELAGMRREYPIRDGDDGHNEPGLSEQALAPTWLEQFRRWFADAVAAPGIVEPNAMVVATADAAGRSSVRTVLLKRVDEGGFVFFSNYESRKAADLAVNPAVGLLFGWHPIGRQVVVDGQAERIDRAETEAYFATRPRLSQLGAWASPQSRVVADRETLERSLAEVDARFPGEVPAPPHWGGFRITPQQVEFWQGQPNRLHDRLRYRRTDTGHWIVERLGP